jgi:DNA-binding transcriptional MerR regulator
MSISSYTIGHAAPQVPTSVSTLKLWERLKLLVPARDSQGRRQYTPEDIERAREIAAQRRANQSAGLRRKAQEAVA